MVEYRALYGYIIYVFLLMDIIWSFVIILTFLFLKILIVVNVVCLGGILFSLYFYFFIVVAFEYLRFMNGLEWFE